MNKSAQIEKIKELWSDYKKTTSEDAKLHKIQLFHNEASIIGIVSKRNTNGSFYFYPGVLESLGLIFK